MVTTFDDHFDLSARPEINVPELAARLFPVAWRTGFNDPGFAVIDLGPSFGSRPLRALMVSLKRALSDLNAAATGKRFVYLSMGRFDQQTTTKFHRDGAPAESLLMLGYEPTAVAGRLSMADYVQCADRLGLTPDQFLEQYNPMYRKGEDELKPFVTELTRFDHTHFQIVLINNSSAPYRRDQSAPLGVLHKAEIRDPDPSQRRIINSTMLAAVSGDAPETVPDAQQLAFIEADQISERKY